LLLLAGLAGATFYALPRAPGPVSLSYEVSLAGAGQGKLTVYLTLHGKLPRGLRLITPAGLAPGAAGGATSGVTTTLLSASHPLGDGRAGPELPVEQTNEAWVLRHAGQRETRLVYQVTLDQASALDQDIRNHLSAAAAGGVRIAGFHSFLLPERILIEDLSVRFRQTTGGRLAAPWPTGPATAGLPALRTAGLLPGNRSIRDPHQVFLPADLRDLGNSLIAWGDLRPLEREVEGCSLRLAMSDRWLFADTDLMHLLTRIAAAEISFFGSAPHPAILVLVAPNPVLAREGFDYYGVHLGQSVLLFLAPETTFADLSEQAASVAAHEMFHGWLGEAIRQEDPAMLWFVEGATTWYAARFLAEAGIWSPRRAAAVLRDRIERDYHTSRLLHAESIAAAAAGVMRDGDNTRFAYAGGCLAAAALDRRLAGTDPARHPLDDILRRLYERRSAEALSRRDLEAAVLAVTGIDCAAWLDRHVYGKEPLPPLDPMF